MRDVTPGRRDWRESLAWWMDEAFSVPGTRIRFGLDALFGLVPGAGDWVTSVVQAMLVVALLGDRRVPASVGLRLVANVALDAMVGAIPFLGDLFDVFFKANTRNIALIRRVEEEQRRTGAVSARPHIAYLAVLVTLLFGAVATAGVAAFFLAKLLYQLITG